MSIIPASYHIHEKARKRIWTSIGCGGTISIMDLARAVAVARTFSGSDPSPIPGSPAGRVSVGDGFVSASTPTRSARVWIAVPGIAGGWSVSTRVIQEAASRVASPDQLAIDLQRSTVGVGRWRVAADVRVEDVPHPPSDGMARLDDPLPAMRLAAVPGAPRDPSGWRAVAAVGPTGCLVVDERVAVSSGTLDGTWRVRRDDLDPVVAALDGADGSISGAVGDEVVLSRGDVTVSTSVPVLGPEHAAESIATRGGRVAVDPDAFRAAVARAVGVGPMAWVGDRIVAVGRGVAFSAPAGGRISMPATVDTVVERFLAPRSGDVEIVEAPRRDLPDRIVFTVGCESLVVQCATPSPDQTRAASIAM